MLSQQTMRPPWHPHTPWCQEQQPRCAITSGVAPDALSRSHSALCVGSNLASAPVRSFAKPAGAHRSANSNGTMVHFMVYSMRTRGNKHDNVSSCDHRCRTIGGCAAEYAGMWARAAGKDLGSPAPQCTGLHSLGSTSYCRVDYPGRTDDGAARTFHPAACNRVPIDLRTRKC